MSERFELLKPHLQRFKRTFSVLDLGSGIEPNQNIGQEIAREFENARVVSVEKNWTGEKFEASRRTIVLKHEMTAEDLRRLAECEHFDVVLALNVLHWFKPEEISGVLVALFKLGDVMFVQIPGAEEVEACGQETTPIVQNWINSIASMRGEAGFDIGHLGATVQFPGHPPRGLWRVEQKIKIRILTMSGLESHPNSARTTIYAGTDTINCGMKGVVRPWKVGVNLWNCCLLGMVWPERERVLGLLRNFPLPAERHGDVTPWNFVFDGEELTLVDGFEEWGGEDRECLIETVRKVGEKLGEERIQCLG